MTKQVSSIARHPRWPEVLAAGVVERGANDAVEKRLLDLARVEEECRAIAVGANLAQEISRLERRIEELTRATEPCRTCRRAAAPELLKQLDEAETAHAGKLKEFEARRARQAEIEKARTEAHTAAAGALLAAFKKRLHGLAAEARALIVGAPEVARRHPARLPDAILNTERQVMAVSALALAFSAPRFTTPGEGDFYHHLGEDFSELVRAKWRAGRSAVAAVAAS
jgi:hypothetical protein